MIETRLERMEKKLDQAISLGQQAHTGLGWLRWIVGGAWAAIAALLYGRA